MLPKTTKFRVALVTLVNALPGFTNRQKSNMSRKVFINYRRKDLDGYAERIQQCIEAEFGAQSVFLDKDINYAEPWPERIRRALEEAEIVLALIGDRWFEEKGDADLRPRIDDPKDWVRVEIEEALKAGKTVLPVLIEANERHFLARSSYPRDSVWLCKIRELQAVRILKCDFDHDIRKLLDWLAAQPGMVKPVARIEPRKLAFDPLQDLPLPTELTGKMPPERAPYVGLRPFRRDDAPIFFGRSQEILELYYRIGEGKRLILFYGSSGVGKSSLLFAGLFPRLEGKYKRYYHRRDKEHGLAAGLAAIITELREGREGSLVMLDQVEEMFTDPNPTLPEEPAQFARELDYAIEQFPLTQFILSFRSDYYVDVENLMRQQRLLFTKYQLKPLGRRGILEAVRGVTETELNEQFGLEIPDEVCEAIADQLSRDPMASLVPLLQAQLRLLWDRACEQRTLPYAPVIIGPELLEKYGQESLSAFLDNQLTRLEGGPWQAALRNGLVNDVLYFCTTGRATAASHSEATIATHYEQEEVIRLLHTLKDLYLLASAETREGRRIRLAHDALAPAVRERFHDSDAPAQRAWRILDAKSKDIAASRPVEFSSTDVTAVRDGLPWMRRISSEEERAIESSKARVEREEEDRRVKNNFQFETFRDTATQLLYSLDHEKALQQFRGAIESEVPLPVKSEGLEEGLKELMFFGAEAGQLELAREAGTLLLDLPQAGEEATLAIRHCVSGAAAEARTYRELFQDHFPVLYKTFRNRYYPQMIRVPGETFSMGDDDGDYSNSKPAHNVKVSAFGMAKSLCTFYQYSLYCSASGDDDIADHSPPWGRRGDHPMVLVRWYEAVRYANWLSRQLGLEPVYSIDKKNPDPNNMNPNDWMKWTVRSKATANGFRLPTEAEWEWAARGGPSGRGLPFSGTGQADEVAWYEGNSPKGTQPVGRLSANELGFHDFSGNVWEWCWDWYDEKYYRRCNRKGTVQNPTGPGKGKERVLRGGSYFNSPNACKVTVRNRNNPDSRNYVIGFRFSQDL